MGEEVDQAVAQVAAQVAVQVVVQVVAGPATPVEVATTAVVVVTTGEEGTTVATAIAMAATVWSAASSLEACWVTACRITTTTVGTTGTRLGGRHSMATVCRRRCLDLKSATKRDWGTPLGAVTAAAATAQQGAAARALAPAAARHRSTPRALSTATATPPRAAIAAAVAAHPRCPSARLARCALLRSRGGTGSGTRQ